MQVQRQQRQREEENKYYLHFINALKSKSTKEDYSNRLSYFMNYLKITKYNELIENRDKKWIEDNIKHYLWYLRNDRKISYKSAAHYLDAVKKFYYVNSDYEFKWDLIRDNLGDDDDTDGDFNNSVDGGEDRPYTKAEIQTMLNTANDIRTKIIILLISSSGMRSGAIHLLKYRNLTKIDNKKYNLYQINVYEKTKKSNYKTFCTPECASMIDTYLKQREYAGETINPESPLIREQYNPKDKFKVKNPKSVSKALLKYLVNEVLTKHSTLKQKLEYDYENKRKVGKNETMLTHALRKYFDTESRKAGVYSDIVELLMGHRLPGTRKHYFKPDIQTLLEGTAECKGYIYAIDSLTINDEFRLKKENSELQLTIDKKMKEMENENQILRSQVSTLNKQVMDIDNAIGDTISHLLKKYSITDRKLINKFKKA